MEIDQLFGLPAHPLLVHVPVVLVPLAALMAVVFAIRPAWLDRFGWALLGVSGIGALGAVLAAGSGEALEERVDETAALERHAELGETARLIAVVFFLVVLAIVVFRSWAKRRAAGGTGGKDIARTGLAAIVTSLLLVGGGGAAGYAVADAGHQGAKVTWEEDVKSDAGNDGGGVEVEDDDD